MKVNLIQKIKLKIIIGVIILMAGIRKIVIPQAIDAFNTYITAVLAYLTANAVRLGIAAADILALTALVNTPITGWGDLFTKHSNATDRTTTVNHDLHDRERAITLLLQAIYKRLDRRIMTNADFDTLQIPKPKATKTKRAKITNVPYSIMYSVRGSIMHFICRITHDASRASMDPLADAIEVRGIMVGINDPLPTDPMACPIDFTSTHAIFDHNFLPSDAGKKFCCFIRFVNLSDDSKNGGWSTCIFYVVSM